MSRTGTRKLADCQEKDPGLRMTGVRVAGRCSGRWIPAPRSSPIAISSSAPCTHPRQDGSIENDDPCTKAVIPAEFVPAKAESGDPRLSMRQLRRAGVVGDHCSCAVGGDPRPSMRRLGRDTSGRRRVRELERSSTCSWVRATLARASRSPTSRTHLEIEFGGVLVSARRTQANVYRTVPVSVKEGLKNSIAPCLKLFGLREINGLP